MRFQYLAAAALGAALALPGPAQSIAEQLQKGIYAQQTTGDLDCAIRIYRQIIASNPAQRIYGAQAQMHLAQALLQKGDLSGAAQEFTTLSANYSEFHDMIAGMASRMAGVEHKPVISLGAVTPTQGEPYQYKDYLTGVELNIPAGWKIESDRESSGGGDMVFLSSPNLKAEALTVYLSPSAGTAVDHIARQLRKSLDLRTQARASVEGWKVRPESVQMRTAGGQQALSAIADYSETSRRVLLLGDPTVQSPSMPYAGGNVVTTFPNASVKMVEYMIWAQSPKTHVNFHGTANAADLAALQAGLDQLAATAVIP